MEKIKKAYQYLSEKFDKLPTEVKSTIYVTLSAVLNLLANDLLKIGYDNVYVVLVMQGLSNITLVLAKRVTNLALGK